MPYEDPSSGLQIASEGFPRFIMEIAARAPSSPFCTPEITRGYNRQLPSLTSASHFHRPQGTVIQSQSITRHHEAQPITTRHYTNLHRHCNSSLVRSQRLQCLTIYTQLSRFKLYCTDKDGHVGCSNNLDRVIMRL